MTVAESWTHGDAEVEPGVRLHFVEQRPGGVGRRPLMVLLHGFPEFWYSWRHQIPAMAAAGYHVVAPDLRGYNDSSKPRGVGAYRLERLARDVRALIEHFGETEAVVVGHDWGGIVAFQLAFMRPEVVRALIVMNAPHPGAFAQNMRRGWRLNVRQLRRSWYMFFFQIPWLPEFVLSRGNYRTLASVLRGTAVRKEAFSDEDVRRFQEAAAKRGALTAALNYYRALFRSGMGPAILAGQGRVFPLLHMPTLAIWGEEDTALGVELTQGMEEFFAGPFEIRYLPDTSHWVQQERPDECNRLLLEFLRRQGVAPAT